MPNEDCKAEAIDGNVVLSCGEGNHVGLRRLPGGAEGIRTSDLPSSGTRALDGTAASPFRLYGFMRLSDKEKRRKSGSALIANGRLTSAPAVR